MAIALGYAHQRMADIKKANGIWRTVCFIDLGCSNFSLSVVEFSDEYAKVLMTNSDRNIGARNFDHALSLDFAKRFKEEFGEDPLSHPKSKLQMMEAIEKIRKDLTSNEEVEVNIDELYNDEDFYIESFDREQFEEINMEIKEKMITTLK